MHDTFVECAKLRGMAGSTTTTGGADAVCIVFMTLTTRCVLPRISPNNCAVRVTSRRCAVCATTTQGYAFRARRRRAT